MSILEIRILPPLAIARLGSSSEPLENYDLVVEDPLGHRTIRPCETLRVDRATGEIAEAYTPGEIRFRDGDRIRPVAPFLEVFARTGADVLEPLTQDLLKAEGLGPEHLRWTVTLGNIKAFRRTDDVDDKILATASFSDHAPHPLEGECANFLPGKCLPLGSVQYIKPTPAFPEIRLRYTPAAGLVYGASARRITGDGPDGPTSEPEPVLGGRIVYDGSKTTARWKGYFDKTLPTDTNPGAIYAGYTDKNDQQVSWG
jgi:hypothetical protein